MGDEQLESIKYGFDLEALLRSMKRAVPRILPDATLLARLEEGLPSNEREVVLRDIETRIRSWTTADLNQLALTLMRLHYRHAHPGPNAQEVDRLLRRLLKKLRGREARKLALECAASPRAGRRQAAWQYFGAQGLDDEARHLVAGSAPSETGRPFCLLIAHDAALIQQVGIELALHQQEDSYWRGRVLQTVFENDGQIPRTVIGAHPVEALFAVRRSERIDLIPLASSLVDENRRNPEVLEAAIALFAQFGAHELLMETMSHAQALLDTAPSTLRSLGFRLSAPDFSC